MMNIDKIAPIMVQLAIVIAFLFHLNTGVIICC